MDIRIVDLAQLDEKGQRQAARILMEAFHVHWPGSWETLEDALAEVGEMRSPERIGRAALEDGVVVGLIGGIPQYDGHVWELHPLAVRPDRQRRGIGALLVRDLEEQVRARGGLTITLGTDDEDDMTSLAGVDLYQDLWVKIRKIQNFKDHPFAFYHKMGYTITGVVPDANGRGKPDILMSKRV